MPLEAPRSAFVCDEESRPRTREERQVFLRHAGLSRERLEVAPYDACVVKPSLACQPLKPFAIVEPQPRRHRLGRGGSSSILGVAAQDDEPGVGAQHLRISARAATGFGRNPRTPVIAAQVKIASGNGNRSALASRTSRRPRATASRFSSRASRTISGLWSTARARHPLRSASLRNAPPPQPTSSRKSSLVNASSANITRKLG